MKVVEIICEAGDFTFEISSGGVSRSVSITVTPSDIEAHAETDALALCLKSEGRSNAEENRAEWVSGEISAALTGFNFKSDGWQHDGEGITALRVSGDARVHIPYKIFESDFRTTGRTIELEFATRQVMDYDAVILSCLSGGGGFRLQDGNSARHVLILIDKTNRLKFHNLILLSCGIFRSQTFLKQ